MRFTNLSQEATQRLWENWKYIVREILEEFNEDVFQGNGIIRENIYTERSYLSLETQHGCLYVFPMPGDEILLSVYRHKIDKEALSRKDTAIRSDPENIVGTIHLLTALIDERNPPAKVKMRAYLAEGLRRIYIKYWMR